MPSTDEELAKRNSRWLKIARWKENQLSLGGGRAELFDSSRSSSQSKTSTQAGQEAGEDEGERIREAPEVEEDKQRKLQKKSDEERKKWGAGEDFFFVGEEGNSVSPFSSRPLAPFNHFLGGFLKRHEVT